jgi:hypothetical protein
MQGTRARSRRPWLSPVKRLALDAKSSAGRRAHASPYMAGARTHTRAAARMGCRTGASHAAARRGSWRTTLPSGSLGGGWSGSFRGVMVITPCVRQRDGGPADALADTTAGCVAIQLLRHRCQQDGRQAHLVQQRAHEGHSAEWLVLRDVLTVPPQILHLRAREPRVAATWTLSLRRCWPRIWKPTESLCAARVMLAAGRWPG